MDICIVVKRVNASYSGPITVYVSPSLLCPLALECGFSSLYFALRCHSRSSLCLILEYIFILFITFKFIFQLPYWPVPQRDHLDKSHLFSQPALLWAPIMIPWAFSSPSVTYRVPITYKNPVMLLGWPKFGCTPKSPQKQRGWRKWQVPMERSDVSTRWIHPTP